MNVQERIDLINKLLEELENHCMCAEFLDHNNVYVVIYPQVIPITREYNTI